MSRLRMMMAVMAVAAPALAQSPLPDLDIETICAERNPVRDMRLKCIRAQMDNKDALRPTWVEASEGLRRRCAAVAKNYGELGYCLSTQGEALPSR